MSESAINIQRINNKANSSVVREYDYEITFVIVSWNVVDMLTKCIESIITNRDGLSTQIIVVDNASTDKTVSKIRSLFPSIELVDNSKNHGFAKANNQGFKIARGRFIFILNPDAVLLPEALRILYDTLVKFDDIGVVGPKIFYPDLMVQNTCARRFPTLTSAFLCNALKLHRIPLTKCLIEQKVRYPYDYDKEQAVEAISGAAMLVREEVIDELAGFGESYLHGGEDYDLCRRVWEFGKRVYYNPKAQVIHKRWQSGRQASLRVYVNNVLSQQEYFRMNYGKVYAVCFRLIVSLIEVPVSIVIAVVKYTIRKNSLSELRKRLQIAVAVLPWKPVRIDN